MCTPIGRLSDEIIVHIMKESDSYHYRDRENPDGIGFRSAFAVCSRWRNIAINSPILWTRIPLPITSDIFSLFVERSRNLPLSVYIRTSNAIAFEGMLDILGSSLRRILARIVFLYISWNPGWGNTKEVTQSLNNFLAEHIKGMEFTSLTTLHIDSHTLHYDPNIELNMPVLKNLRYDGLPYSFPRFINTDSVVKLSLKGTPICHWELPEIIDAFSHVKYLNLGDIQPPDNDEEMDPEASTWLPKLRTLHLHTANVGYLDETVRYLDVPLMAFMHLKTWHDPESSVSFQDFMSRYLVEAYDWSVVTVPIEPRSPARIFHHTVLSQTKCDFDLKFGAESEAIIPLLELAPYSSNLSTIDLTVQHLPPLPDLIQAISHWSNVQFLGVHTEATEFERLLEAFLTFERDSPLPCPLLETFDCTMTKFQGELVIRLLEGRKARGAPLQELTYTKGFLDQPETDARESSFSAQARALVEKVDEVDPVEGPDPEDYCATEIDRRLPFI
ncbi:hypothetical protein SISNIDRAFT_487048 [Sistotremastrum niveocremeum HHB9708]|uniref:Uncharacterized protein n=1 Tax=Sistotremastrum niveocremeum HHB9708 TaxID=1314777 RepID=A0A164SRJ2_9AGAM|nr:hypothetical protein SISNIDRAFT_487048 [Sistotremastrum niveocremeum HHB9708]